MFLIRDALGMIREIRALGGAISLWGALLNLPQLIGGVIFVAHVEGRAILAGLVVTLMVAGQIHRRAPFSRLTGFCHLPWLVMLPGLIWRLAATEMPWPLAAWVVCVAATVAISLVFDAADVVRYLRGDRRFTWAQ